MFTVQDWISFYFGKLVFGDEANKVANVMCYLNTQVISHMLALTSKQMGISDKNLFRLKMKNEYNFPIYIRGNRAKHYATLNSSREGNVYKVPKIELKGVAIKDSKVPKVIMKALETDFYNIMMRLMEGHGINIYPIMQRIANFEHEIFKSLSEGRLEYLQTQSISPKATYKAPMSSKYMNYDLWLKVFQETFTEIAPPPYRAVKISTILNNKTALMEWVQWMSVTNPAMSKQLAVWIKDNNKTALNQLLLPAEIFEGGLDPLFVRIMDTRKMVAELLSGYYILLGMLGMYNIGKKLPILLSDDIPYRPMEAL
jgi:hypothetical protein